MPKPVDEDRARRKELLEQKKAARRAAKEGLETRAACAPATAATAPPESEPSLSAATAVTVAAGDSSCCPLLTLPLDSLHVIYSMLSAAELGRLTLTCTHLNRLLSTAHISYLISRLATGGATTTSTATTTTTIAVQLLGGGGGNSNTEAEARDLWWDCLTAGGDTGRSAVPRHSSAVDRQTYNQFIGYARFLEEAVCGYSVLSFRRGSHHRNHHTSHSGGGGSSGTTNVRLPTFVQGRWASCSPEHSLCRVGGDGLVEGPGGSGVASWGVGKRGQLGHGVQRDERHPRRLLLVQGRQLGGLRIVQVSAGGGLVRVAHSLLLTSTGRVLSFGTGQYGALGHGFSAAKQLPDYLKPSYVEALQHVCCVCVAAGELHSAAVTSDGDVYSWGDGFCGQLGHGDKRPAVSPKQVTAGNLDEECISNISCGSRHTLAVSEDGECFSWGLGHFGVLGRSFTPFEYDADAAVVALAMADGGESNNNDNGVRLGAMQNVNGEAPPRAAVVVERDADAELAAHLDLIANLSLDDSSDQCIPKVIDSLKDIKVVGASAGHRHSLLLDAHGALYSFGAGSSGCLGHGDTANQMYPCRIQAFDDDNTRIMQMSAGVDMSMAVSTTGHVFAWGKTDAGRIGLGLSKSHMTLPRRVYLSAAAKDEKTTPAAKAVDVECGYVHSLIVGLNGTIHLCGGVGVDGEDDGQQQQADDENRSSIEGQPRQVADFNIWHRKPEPKAEQVTKERWTKLDKYEVKGRSKMLSGDE